MGEGDGLGCLGDGDRHPRRRCTEIIRIARLGGADRTGAGGKDRDGAPRNGADTERVARIGNGAAPRAAAARQCQRCGGGGWVVGAARGFGHGGQRCLARFIDREAARHARGGKVVAGRCLARRDRAGARGENGDHHGPRGNGADIERVADESDAADAATGDGAQVDQTGAISGGVGLGEGDRLCRFGDGDG